MNIQNSSSSSSDSSEYDVSVSSADKETIDYSATGSERRANAIRKNETLFRLLRKQRIELFRK